jgi:hypothetical protein
LAVVVLVAVLLGLDEEVGVASRGSVLDVEVVIRIVNRTA